MLSNRVTLSLEVLLLKRNGVVEKEVRSVFETLWECSGREILKERVRDIGEKEGNVVGQLSGEDSGQSGERSVDTRGDTWSSAIGDDENGGDRVDVLLDLSGNTLFRGIVLWKMASIGESRHVEDANLRKRLPLLTTVTNTSTHHYAVLARKFVKAGRFGLALVAGTTTLVGGIEVFKLVMINVVASKDIGEEFHD